MKAVHLFSVALNFKTGFKNTRIPPVRHRAKFSIAVLKKSGQYIAATVEDALLGWTGDPVAAKSYREAVMVYSIELCKKQYPDSVIEETVEFEDIFEADI